MGGLAIEAKGLGRSFGAVVAVEGLDLQVAWGEVFALLGPNGAGKTTTVRLLSTLLRPTSGTATVDGRPVQDDPALIRAAIGLLPEQPGLYGTLSAQENLEFYARLHGMARGERGSRIEELLRLLGIWPRRSEPVATFSKGMQQKIAIARAIVHRPRILFLDEPTASLDPESATVVREFIEGLRREGGTIFLNTHNLYEAERLANRVGILSGRLLTVGTPAEVRARAGPSRLLVRLKDADPGVRKAVEALEGVRGVTVDGTRLVVEVDDPERHAPCIADTVVRHGGRLIELSDVSPSLEAVYLQTVRGARPPGAAP